MKEADRIVEALEEGVIVLDAAGIAVSVNPAAPRLLGLPEDAILGRRPPFVGGNGVFLTDGRRLDARTSPALATLKDGEPRHIVTRRIEEDGREVHMRLSTTPHEGGVLLTVRDVTAEKRVERVLRDERDSARHLLDLAGTVILVVDADGHISIVNRAASALLGYHDGELVGQDFFDTLVPVDQREARRKAYYEFVGAAAPSTWSRSPRS